MKDKFKLDKAFCCAGFQHLVADAGQRGIAVLVVATSDGIRFRLQSRGIAFEDESKIRPMPGCPDIKINVSCMTGLKYCPFCGRRLFDMAKASPQAYAELARKHLQFNSDSQSPGTSVIQP